MAHRMPKNMPCTRECPDRRPGCYCEKKREWDEKNEAQKKLVRDIKSRDSMIQSIRTPDRVIKKIEKGKK